MVHDPVWMDFGAGCAPCVDCVVADGAVSYGAYVSVKVVVLDDGVLVGEVARIPRCCYLLWGQDGKRESGVYAACRCRGGLCPRAPGSLP